MEPWGSILRQVPSSIKTGYSLMALAFVLFAFLASRGHLEREQVFLLTAGMLVVALACVFILRGSARPTGGEERGAAPESILDVNLRSLVDCSELPAYATDANLIVRHCNSHLLSFIGAQRSQILDKHVSKIIDRFVELVPEARRQAFIDRQAKVVKEAEQAPYAAISEVVDLSRRVAGLEDRMFRTWIHADIIYSREREKEIGWFVVYHPVEVEEDESGRLLVVDREQHVD